MKREFIYWGIGTIVNKILSEHYISELYNVQRILNTMKIFYSFSMKTSWIITQTSYDPVHVRIRPLYSSLNIKLKLRGYSAEYNYTEIWRIVFVKQVFRSSTALQISHEKINHIFF